MLKLNPITGQMDLINSISDNPEGNSSQEAASTAATKIIADNLANEVQARNNTDLDMDAETNERINADYAITHEVKIDINFLFLADYIFNVPRKMKFTAQTSEGTPATLSIPLNTEMLPYVKLIVTPTQIGLIELEGVELP